MRSRNGKKNKSKVLHHMGVLTAPAAVLAINGVSAGSAHGEVVTVSNKPRTLSFSLSSPATVGWDVDGNGLWDWRLRRSSSTYTWSWGGHQYQSTWRVLAMQSYRKGENSLGGRGIVAKSIWTDWSGGYYYQNGGAVKNLVPGFKVGPDLPARYFFAGTTERRGTYTWNGEKYTTTWIAGGSKYVARFAKAYSSYGVSYPDRALIRWNMQGFESGIPGYFGFRFVDDDGATHYGWAEMVITIDEVEWRNSEFTITRWAYETEAGKPIFVGGVVPEPATTGLLALAAGAVGVTAWRANRRRRKW